MYPGCQQDSSALVVALGVHCMGVFSIWGMNSVAKAFLQGGSKWETEMCAGEGRWDVE